MSFIHIEKAFREHNLHEVLVLAGPKHILQLRLYLQYRFNQTQKSNQHLIRTLPFIPQFAGLVVGERRDQTAAENLKVDELLFLSFLCEGLVDQFAEEVEILIALASEDVVLLGEILKENIADYWVEFWVLLFHGELSQEVEVVHEVFSDVFWEGTINPLDKEVTQIE